MKEDFSFLRNGYIICSCEGTAEEVVMDILLDNDCLIFNRQNLIEKAVTRIRPAKTIEERFLRRSYARAVRIIRILDSSREKFRLSKAYAGRFEVFEFRTMPEIETLLIIAENAAQKYHQKYKSKMKPSDFCKSILIPNENIKSKGFWFNYFSNVEKLMNAIREYNRICSDKENSYNLSHLLK